MKTGFNLNSGMVNWPEIKTRRVRLHGPSAPCEQDPKRGRELNVLNVVATNLERFKDQVVQTIQRL